MSYDCRAYPAAAVAEYRPTPVVLAALIRRLVADGWIDASARGSYAANVFDMSGAPTRRMLRPSELDADLEALVRESSSFGIQFDNRRPLPDETRFELDPEGRFLASDCESVYVVSSDAWLPFTDEQGPEDTLSCPSCGKDVLLPAEDHPDSRMHRMFAVLRAGKYVPEQCPHCRITLEPSQLSMRLTRVADERGRRVESAACYKFGLWLAPGDDRYPVDAEYISVESSLAAGLEAVCGVPFRLIGRLA